MREAAYLGVPKLRELYSDNLRVGEVDDRARKMTAREMVALRDVVLAGLQTLHVDGSLLTSVN